MTFEEVFKKIEKQKDKYLISNLLSELENVEPNYVYLDKLLKLATHRTSVVKWRALSLLSNFHSENLENFYLDLLKSKIDNLTIAKCVQGLSINGTERSVELLIEILKKSRDGHVRGNIIPTLRSIYLRNNLSTLCKDRLFNIIGNNYPFFNGYWTDIKKSKKVISSNWKDFALTQLKNNTLNILFELNADIDIQLNIEKMKTHFIRYVNVTVIYKHYVSSFSQYYTPREFYLSENRLFDSILDKTREMRADNYTHQIIDLIDLELLPKLNERINVVEYLKTAHYAEFESQQMKIFDKLYGTNWDFVLSDQLTNSIDIFENNLDKNKYIDFVLQMWRTLGKETFIIKNYLEERKNRG